MKPKITEIEYSRDFKLAPYVNERITVKATYPDQEDIDVNEAIQDLKLVVFGNSSLSKPVETEKIHYDGTRKVSKNGQTSEEDIL